MNTLLPMLADIGGGDIVHQMLFFLVIGICVGLIWWVGRYFIGKFGLPAVVLTGWDLIFILLGLIFLVNFLLGLVGHPLFSYH